MLERGELLTMEEFFEAWTEWKNTKYHTRKHRGLSDAGEQWVTPIEMFENGPRYEKAAPPREYAAMLLMKAATARVTNQGINKFGTLYTDTELATMSIRRSTSSGTSTTSPSSMCTTWRARRSAKRCLPSCSPSARIVLRQRWRSTCAIRNETSARSESIWRSESAPTSCGLRTVQGPRMQWA